MRYLILFMLLASPVLAHPHHDCKPQDPNCQHSHPDKGG
jgi:hypothetical protein